MRAIIAATGSYLPEEVVSNDALTQFPAEVLPLIEQKTGVKARRRASPSQCTSDLAIAAAQRCLERSAITAADVEGIILATSSPDRIQPATAVSVQHAIGAARAFAFDVNSVCSGAIYALQIGRAMIESGQCGNVLVLASEIYSRFLNPKDFATYPYFGDGAGAVLLQSGEGAVGIRDCILRTDGAGADVIQVPGGGTRMPASQLGKPADAYFRMNGKQVYEFAVTKGSEVVLELLRAMELRADDVRLVVAHQANINIIQELAARTGIGQDRFYVNLDRYGNTAAASVPIALDEALGAGQVQAGDRVVLVGFGGGLSWGAMLVQF